MKRVLILDDNRDTLDLLQTSLSEVCDVCAFDRGIDALIKILTGYRDGWQFDALVLDCALPYIDGFTIARTVRQIEETGIAKQQTKIGFFTAYTQTVEQSTLLAEVKADRYFRKPEDMGQLPELISAWLREEK